MFRILRVRGESMLPVYRPGDFVIVRRVSRSTLKAGDVVVFENFFYGMLIKKIDKVREEGVYVLGTGENSLDSRRLGPVPLEAIQGKVIWHIRR